MRYEVTVKFDVEADTLTYAQNKVESILFRGGHHTGLGGSDSYTGPSYRVISVIEDRPADADVDDSPEPAA